MFDLRLAVVQEAVAVEVDLLPCNQIKAKSEPTLLNIFSFIPPLLYSIYGYLRLIIHLQVSSQSNLNIL
ncbi:MAG: hypothetical protein Sv326_0614 [Candidatus Fermentimicrarchaeum limneticum]|uniref:Uncharacterized protein n=1 Tax=Fermentimicrarchaeum limneticum TaxID=2795018 RepID=A0A7D5XJN7_FERL1|nr:MAG: hypothetical protein Sv326_0614 [Candidatus Fermentimicrarchaeum limneticum]